MGFSTLKIYVRKGIDMKEFLFLYTDGLDEMCDMQYFKIKANNEQDVLILACKRLYLDDELFMDRLDQIVLLESDEIDDEADDDAFKEVFIKKAKDYFGAYKESGQAYLDFIFSTKNEHFAYRQKFIDVSEGFLLKEYMDYIEESYKIIDLEEIRIKKE